jgi:hypothetical protein
MSEETGRQAIDFVYKTFGQQAQYRNRFFRRGTADEIFDVVIKLTYFIKEQEKYIIKNFWLTMTTNGICSTMKNLNL